VARGLEAGQATEAAQDVKTCRFTFAFLAFKELVEHRKQKLFESLLIVGTHLVDIRYLDYFAENRVTGSFDVVPRA